MNPEYRTAARRHRWLLLVPIVLAPIIAMWVVLGTPNEYKSTASLWFDTPPPADSSVTHPDATLTPPAAQAQVLLNELLQTKQFRSRVGTQAQLTAYLNANPAQGWDPLALMKRLKGDLAIDDRLKVALGPAHVGSEVDGPQILTISVRQPSPSVARTTLEGLIAQFQQEKSDLGRQRATSAVEYYTNQVAVAKLADDAAVQQIKAYRKLNPKSTTTDPSLAILTTAEQAASAKLLDAQNNLNLARIGQTGSTDESAMRLIDPPSDPRGPVRGMKALVLAVFAGLFGGLVVAVAGLFGLVSLGRLRARAGFADHDAELVRLLATDRAEDLLDEPREGGAGVARKRK